MFWDEIDPNKTVTVSYNKPASIIQHGCAGIPEGSLVFKTQQLP
jgi:hypothetical protein